MEQPDKYGLYEDEKESTGLENMVAYHSTILALNSIKPCGGLFTYNLEEDTVWAQYLLAKVLPYININDELFGPSDATEYKSFDIPGGVIGQYKIKNIVVKIEMYPLIYGREEQKDMGGAVYYIHTTPAVPVVLNIGGGKKNDMVGWDKVLNEEGIMVDLMVVRSRATMVSEKFRGEEATVEIENGIAILTSSHPYTVAIKTNDCMQKEISRDGGQYLSCRFVDGCGEVTFSFDRDKGCSTQLIYNNSKIELEKSKQYYTSLLKSQINTPSETLNFAFKSAIYNIDYNYLAPLGWVESVHHWLSLWHQQHTLVADWLGQEERSKLTIMSQARRLYPDGAAPMMLPNGKPFRAFGGTDQFFAWQVRHYLQHTNDISFANEVLPYFEKVISHCFKENDPDGKLSLHWGLQIGNQEDYISHPHVSTTPSIEAINMLESIAECARIANECDKSKHYLTLAAKSKDSLKQLWNVDLGRFIYMIDSNGKEHLDGQYQTHIYPVIYKMLDCYDSYTSMRHVRDRLIGSEGELYCSNNFPNHMAATLGTQAGVAQQPWGAMGLAAAGYNDEAVLPLEFIAKVVFGNGCEGSWPEAVVPYGTYFSPPASVFLQAVIEYIYGLTLDIPKETIQISPCFPKDWDTVGLELPYFKVDFKKKNNAYTYQLTTSRPYTAIVKWRFPFGEIKNLLVNGKTVEFKLSPAVNGFILECTLLKSEKNIITFEFSEIPMNIDFPKVVVEGQKFCISTNEFHVTGIVDRSGLTKEINYKDDLTITLKEDILKPYLKYGKLGLLNFSRRTIFLKLLSKNGQETIYAVDLTIIPAIEATGKLHKNSLDIFIRKNTAIDLKSATILAGGQSFSFNASEHNSLQLPNSFMDALLPGKNKTMLSLQNGNYTYFDIKSKAKVNTRKIDIPNNLFVDDTEWIKLRGNPNLAQMPWLNQKNPMLGLEESTISHPDLPILFTINPGKFAPVSWTYKPRLDIPLSGEYRKIYICLFPILDNHDVFSPVLRITLKRNDLKLISKEYYYPGDLDGFWSVGSVGCFSTAHSYEQRTDELLPKPDIESGDWSLAKPIPDNFQYFTKDYGNSFPASNMWCDNYAIKLSNGVLNIIEFDLQKPNDLTDLFIEPIGTQPAFGIVAIEAI